MKIRKPVIIVVSVLLVIILIILIGLLSSWSKRAVKGEDTVTVKPTVHIERKRCRYNDDLEAKLKLPRSTEPSQEPLTFISDKNNYLVIETYIDKTSDEPKKRYLVVSPFGSIVDVYYNIAPDCFFKDGFLVAIDTNVKEDLDEEDETLKEPNMYLFNFEKGRISENYNKINPFGNFFMATTNLKDEYGPLFTKTSILNKRGKVIYEYNDNREKPVDLKLTPDERALIVVEYLKKFIVNDEGETIEIPEDAKEEYGYNTVFYEKKYEKKESEDEAKNETKKDLYEVINISTREKKEIGVPAGDKMIPITPNLYSTEQDLFYNGQKINNVGEIKKVDKVFNENPILISCSVVPPKDVKDVGDYYALFRIEGGYLKKVSGDFTEILRDDGLYKPMDNIYYGKNRRENTEGGFISVFNDKGEIILGEKAKIVEVGANGYKIKDLDLNMVYNKKTKSLVPDGLITRMVRKDLNGHEAIRK